MNRRGLAKGIRTALVLLLVAAMPADMVSAQEIAGERTEQTADGQRTEQAADGEKTGQTADGQRTEQTVDGEKTGQTTDGEKTGQTADGQAEEPGAEKGCEPEADGTETFGEGSDPANETALSGEGALPGMEAPPEEGESLAVPVILDAVNVSGGIEITWETVEGADGYRVYRALSASGEKEALASVNATSYTDRQVTPGEKYWYYITAYRTGEQSESETETVTESGWSKKKTIVYLVAPSVTADLASAGIQIRWNRTDGAKGYYVYRRLPGQDAWTRVFTTAQPGEIAWCDTSAANGAEYQYTVQVYNGTSVSPYAEQRSYIRLSAPAVKKWKKKSSKKWMLKWSKNTAATGYQIQYAQNAMFSGAKTVKIKGSGTSSRTFSKLKKNKTYYARIRAYKTVGNHTYYSAWSAAGNTKTTRTLKASLLKKKKKAFEIRSRAGQKMYQFDTLQGSCTDGTYAYYLLYNRKALMCKVVKVKLSNLKVVGVSAALSVAHGNDMTYDPAKRRLVIVHSTGSDPKALTSVNPDTLTVIEFRHITIPNKLAGGTTADATNATAFSGIAYSSGRKQYAVLLSHNYNFVLLDADMNPIQYVKVTKKNNYTVQSIDATDDYILLAQSPKSSKQKYNIITVYDWDGNYIAKINVKKGYEIESVYHVGSKYYAGFYYSYYKTTYKKVVKKVKVGGKVKKKKVKVKQRKLQRDNYVYQITGI